MSAMVSIAVDIPAPRSQLVLIPLDRTRAVVTLGIIRTEGFAPVSPFFLLLSLLLFSDRLQSQTAMSARASAASLPIVPLVRQLAPTLLAPTPAPVTQVIREPGSPARTSTNAPREQTTVPPEIPPAPTPKAPSLAPVT